MRLRSHLGNHVEKGSQNNEKKRLPKMKNLAFLMEGCSKSHFRLTAKIMKKWTPQSRIWGGFWSPNRRQIDTQPFRNSDQIFDYSENFLNQIIDDLIQLKISKKIKMAFNSKKKYCEHKKCVFLKLFYAFTIIHINSHKFNLIHLNSK